MAGAGLLGDIYSTADSIKRRVKGLLGDPVGTVQQSLGILAEDAKSAFERQKKMIHDPQSITVDDVAAAMNSASAFAPFGMTVWHGSPHRFSKFDMSKIGTGEGAQAYGHGLYMAESPEVAMTYQQGLAGKSFFDTKTGERLIKKGDALANRLSDKYGISDLQTFDDMIRSGDIDGIPKKYINAEKQYRQRLKEDFEKHKSSASLYKVDIPDEAVARFLDWDKPLSEEMRQPLSKALMDKFGSGVSMGSGEQAYKQVLDEFKFSGHPDPKNAAIQWMNENGIPGIRYLDGGSRSAGQGSSNFVLFDDQLPRILETNGVPTGQVPWKPGEWQGLLGKTPEAPRAEAMRIAQQNAAKPVSEGGLGLRPDNTPMERAKAMGFYDKSMYHATTNDFPYFDLNRSGEGTTISGSERAVFMSDKPSVANEYIANPWTLVNGEVVRPYANGAQVMPLVVRSENPAKWDMGGAGYDSSFVSSAIKDARKHHEDMVVFGQMKDPSFTTLGSGEKSNIVAALNPSNIRSRFAAFDPARRHEADLLGQVNPELLPWLIGGGLLGGYGVKQAQE